MYIVIRPIQYTDLLFYVIFANIPIWFHIVLILPLHADYAKGDTPINSINPSLPDLIHSGFFPVGLWADPFLRFSWVLSWSIPGFHMRSAGLLTLSFSLNELNATHKRKVILNSGVVVCGATLTLLMVWRQSHGYIFFPHSECRLLNMEVNSNAKLVFAHATTLKLHTGNLVNRCRLRNKCPSSPCEEVKAVLHDI